MKKEAKTKSSLSKTEKLLIENFVKLQKVMTNQATKLENLTLQISKLLQLFEISAKSFVKSH